MTRDFQLGAARQFWQTLTWSEISGSLGDLGTFLPLVVGLTQEVGLDLGTTLLMTGLYNILSGIAFGIPMGVQPMKTIAAVALSTTQMTVPQIMLAGMFVSACVLLLGASKLIDLFNLMIPSSVVRGLQGAVGLKLAMKGVSMCLLTKAASSRAVWRPWWGLEGLLLGMCTLAYVLCSTSPTADGDKELQSTAQTQDQVVQHVKEWWVQLRRCFWPCRPSTCIAGDPSIYSSSFIQQPTTSSQHLADTAGIPRQLHDAKSEAPNELQNTHGHVSRSEKSDYKPADAMATDRPACSHHKLVAGYHEAAPHSTQHASEDSSQQDSCKLSQGRGPSILEGTEDNVFDVEQQMPLLSSSGQGHQQPEEYKLQRSNGSSMNTYQHAGCGSHHGTPAALVVVVTGVLISLVAHFEVLKGLRIGPSIPTLLRPSWHDFKVGVSKAGLAQLPLTSLNSVIAVTQLATFLFPHHDSARWRPSTVAISVGMMNLVGCWLGAMPACHGAGGLAAQVTPLTSHMFCGLRLKLLGAPVHACCHPTKVKAAGMKGGLLANAKDAVSYSYHMSIIQVKFGACTGSAPIFLGLVKVTLSLLFGSSLFILLQHFPQPMLGAMLTVSGMELASMMKAEKSQQGWMVMLFTAVAILGLEDTGMGFLCGLSAAVSLAAYGAAAMRWHRWRKFHGHQPCTA